MRKTMLKPSGLVFETDTATGNVKEIETFMCKHCGKHTVLWKGQPPDEAGGYCYSCGGMVCKACAGKGCDPLEKKLEAWARRENFYARMKEY
jgi:hypothetical protein